MSDQTILVLGPGNDLRQDDGVGWAIADALEQDPPPGARVAARDSIVLWYPP